MENLAEDVPLARFIGSDAAFQNLSRLLTGPPGLKSGTSCTPKASALVFPGRLCRSSRAMRLDTSKRARRRRQCARSPDLLYSTFTRVSLKISPPCGFLPVRYLDFPSADISFMFVCI